jgi:lipid-A-disaccharide synthase
MKVRRLLLANFREDQSSCLVIAGEKSGEEHAMSFLPELMKQFPDIHFYGVGGELLKDRGMELVYHLKDFSSFGVSEVIKKIPFYFKALKNITTLVEKRKTKVAILIDFQDFNMRLAKKLTAKGVKVLYYVAPQAWAWKEYRAKTISDYTTVLYSILPFEKQWFEKRGTKRIESVEHPLVRHYAHELKHIMRKKAPLKTFNLLLLPGSRNSEVKYLLSEFIDAALKLKEHFDVKLSIVKTVSVDPRIYQHYDEHFDTVYQSEDLALALKQANICIASSGTVTLATGLFQLPTVVCYEVSLLNKFIFESFVNYQGMVSLTNLILEKEVFPELLGERATSFNIYQKAFEFMNNPEHYNNCLAELQKLNDLMVSVRHDPTESMARVFREAYAQ